MSNPIFIHPGAQYDSYTDYWRLVELCGFEAITEDKADFDNPDAIYILTMQDMDGRVDSGGWPEAKARLIYYDLEWYPSYAGKIPGLNEFWSPDRWYAQKNGYKWVPLGSHKDLCAVSRYDTKEWDVALLAYMGPYRRSQMRGRLEDRGITIAPNGWGEERRSILERSRIMVHVHQHDDFHTLAAQRFALAASAAIPVVSETMNDCAPLVIGTDYFHNDYTGLPDTVSAILQNDLGRRQAASLHWRLCDEYRFDKCIMKALAE